jgi:serine/threonine protein kinase
MFLLRMLNFFLPFSTLFLYHHLTASQKGREKTVHAALSFRSVPNTVQFYCAWEDASHYFIAMELCPGGDLLERLLGSKRCFSERRTAVEVATPLLRALAALHDLALIHRDIKLENVFVDGSGAVRLGDFGLTMSTRQEAAISPVGTVEYMAPEASTCLSFSYDTA